MRKKRKRDEEEKESRPIISAEIKKSIAAVFLAGAAIILLLASLNKAGPAGGMIFAGLSGFFGWGYYLLPMVALTITFVFLLTREIKFLSPTFIGATVLVASLLGFIDIVFPGKAGLTGNALGLIELPFGKIAALVIVGALVVASLLITLNVPLKIPRRKSLRLEIKELGDQVAASNEQIESGQENAFLEEGAVEVKKSAGGAAPMADKIKPMIAVPKNYKFPPLGLLKSSVEKPTAGDLRANANIIKRTLEGFGIPVEMGEVSIGPKVTRYTLKPAEGVKITRITSLNQDLALALAAHPLRIEAPIPGKSLVGIEVPNKSAAVVRLGSLISYPEFTKSGPLTFILGRDVNGEPIAANIEKMPHLLVSGATGSGKSILIHSIITSLLYKNSPESLRFAFIDPKRVELSVYNNIPHLVAPVVTEGKKAISVFRWAINEMEGRYQTLLDAGSRDISSYNSSRPKTPLPYVVIVVDELADLMAAHGREVEAAVVRLAQMSRATGIHLILSTQRPSVEVITGLIKANITARVALQVASQVDSRTILDLAGAEKLLGGGDMLFVSPEFSKPKRIQGAYISEEEINEVANFIKANNSPTETDDLQAELDERNSQRQIDLENFSGTSDEDDELYEEAVRTVREAKKASASLLQRRLKVGYARAARLLDIMEANGLISPGEGAKPREVYDLKT